MTERLSRFTLDANGVAIAGSETVFIDQNGNSVWHNGGGMFFHPDSGFLYPTDGDDADGGNTQRIDACLFSGVWRSVSRRRSRARAIQIRGCGCAAKAARSSLIRATTARYGWNSRGRSSCFRRRSISASPSHCTTRRRARRRSCICRPLASSRGIIRAGRIV